MRRGLIHIEPIGGSNNYVLWLTKAGHASATVRDVTAPMSLPSRDEIRDAIRVNTLAWALRILAPQRIVHASWNLPAPTVGEWPDVVVLPTDTRSGCGVIIEKSDESVASVALRGANALRTLDEQTLTGSWFSELIILAHHQARADEACALANVEGKHLVGLTAISRPSPAGTSSFLALADLLQPYVV
jgi:hypothetical protein